MAIDRTGRRQLAYLLRQFAVGNISNDEFEDGRPDRTNDPAIDQIYHLGIWPLYPDHEVVRKPLGPSERRFAARMILFLHSDLEYRWPVCGQCSFPALIGMFAQAILSLLTIGLVRRPNAIKLPAGFREAGDFEFWPFLNRPDYQHALESPRFLSGGRAFETQRPGDTLDEIT